jgi:uncharacterized Fe-S cluster-containing MiaB family protein
MEEKKLSTGPAFVINKDRSDGGVKSITVTVYISVEGYRARGKCPHCPYLLDSDLQIKQNDTVKRIGEIGTAHIKQEHM